MHWTENDGLGVLGVRGAHVQVCFETSLSLLFLPPMQEFETAGGVPLVPLNGEPQHHYESRWREQSPSLPRPQDLLSSGPSEGEGDPGGTKLENQ